MKTMTCKQLGGACEIEFTANTFEEMAQLSKAHAMEMFKLSDAAHLEAMQKMQFLIQRPGEMEKWFAKKKKEFEATPENKT